MLTFLARRLVAAVPVLLGVATIVFSLMHIVPGDPVDIVLGERASPADRAGLRRQLGLDRPVAAQYVHFLARLVRGDLGRSLATRRPVARTILRRYPATLELAAGALAISLALAFPLGIGAALHHNRWGDRVGSIVALLGVSVPNFWLGPLLMMLFAVKLGWLPLAGRGGWRHLILPAITLGTALAAFVARMLRSALLDVLQEDYVRTARAKGLPRWRVVGLHALRNALIPVVTVIGLQLGALLAGAVVTETIFQWPGLGKLLITSINSRDYPLVQGCVLAIATTYVAINLATDLVYTWVDPRIRLDGGHD